MSRAIRRRFRQTAGCIQSTQMACATSRTARPAPASRLRISPAEQSQTRHEEGGASDSWSDAQFLQVNTTKGLAFTQPSTSDQTNHRPWTIDQWTIDQPPGIE